jgi:hypothetical protein
MHESSPESERCDFGQLAFAVDASCGMNMATARTTGPNFWKSIGSSTRLGIAGRELPEFRVDE